MALLPSPPDPSRIARLLNKPLIRIAVATLSFIILVYLVLTSRDGGVSVALSLLSYRETLEVYHFSTTSSFQPVSVNPASKTKEELCEAFPKHLINYVQPVLKMGHSEDRAKIEAHLDSVLACFGKDDLLIMSDLDDTIREHKIVDALADLPQSYYDLSKNRDFQNYMWQKEMRDNGTLHGEDPTVTKPIDGWVIDKYKFLPMVERAWMTKPDKPFYFFLEADTYVFWDNVFRFLQTFDPDVTVYMGSPSPGRHDERRGITTWFANGGPGFVLSRGAMKALLHRESGSNGQYIEPPIAEKWLSLLADECCGDSVMGWALWNVSVGLQGYWPMFNPHPLHGIPFSDPYWCQPVLTLHKTTPNDTVDLWRWEFGQRRLHRPLLYSDLWHFRHPGEPGVLENWDNGDWDSWRPPPTAEVDSFESCERFCRKEDQCVQWNWRGGNDKTCILMRSIRYGQAREPEMIPEKRGAKPEEILSDEKPRGNWVDYKSGWVEERIHKWREERRCKEAHWVGPSVTRIF
ncbi:Uncharacterized protein TPAR_04251 [Tolypocladium paradoxum]|uniref:N-acetylgalactosaminide beta-1,3-galactosyltransferase n=1 Tax=Tolypocladium paradoxum TaxID=94208 RepID=A0A2S4KZD6_9HYPO|nr:Uncharacterized protein TPAR_04251 [Tolypocladium paradoxum]